MSNSRKLASIAESQADRQLRVLLILFSILLFLAARSASGQTGPVQTVAAVNMTVSDMDRSVAFYSKVLSFRKVSDVDVAGGSYEHLTGVFGSRMHVVVMMLGDESIELTEYLAPRGRAIPMDSRSNDRWFQHIAIITSDMDKAYAWLRLNKVEHASSGPQRLPDWNPNAGGIQAFYFKDPDGHPLEVLQFPARKGAAKWHAASSNLFLGIDHTAIVVGDTDTSLHFYHDLLGMKIAGTSENYGSEQEHLNNVFGARLRITALRGANGGPGIELLEYLAPRDGRPFPQDEQANDLVHRHTELLVSNPTALARQLQGAHVQFVSSEVVSDPERKLGISSGFLARDPDGHVIEFAEK